MGLYLMHPTRGFRSPALCTIALVCRRSLDLLKRTEGIFVMFKRTGMHRNASRQPGRRMAVDEERRDLSVRNRSAT
jgi:hypothetical protein